MPGFFQTDDDLTSNHKLLALVEGEPYLNAMAAMGVWTLSGTLCRKAGTDGVVTIGSLTRTTLNRAAAAKSAALLVKYRLWHAPGHACEACPQPPDGAWIFHQWFQFNYGTGDAERVAADKRRELRNPVIIEAVWGRDTDAAGVARCRYCAKVVHRPKPGKGGDRRSANVGHLDHIDPSKAIGPTNIVVACKECNETKGKRTPEQAGMVLFDPPINTGINPGINPIDPPINPGPNGELSPPRARAWGGAGVGPGSGQGKGRGGAVPVVPGIDRPWEVTQ